MVLKDYRLEIAYLLGTIDSQDTCILFLHTGLSDQEYSHPHVDDFWHWLQEPTALQWHMPTGKTLGCRPGWGWFQTMMPRLYNLMLWHHT